MESKNRLTETERFIELSQDSKNPFEDVLQKSALKNFEYSKENTCVGASF